MTHHENQNREPSGRPTGGRWAETPRAASGLSLGPQDEVDALVDAFDDGEMTHDQFEQRMLDLFDYVTKRAPAVHQNRTFGSNWDRDDLVQDTMVEMVARARRQGRLAGVTRGYARGYQSGLVARALQAQRQGMDASQHLQVNSPNLAGWRAFTQRVDQLEEAAGRSLTNRERDEVADEIRANWEDPKRRPSPGFHRARHGSSIDTDTYDPGTHTSPSAEAEFFSSENLGGEDVEAVFSTPKRGGAARKFGWNAMCELRGIPKARQGFLNNRQIANCKRLVGSSDSDVLAALEEWESGAHSERTEALWRPFDAQSQSHRALIADTIRDMPDNAGRLYSLALAGATARNFPEKSKQNT